MKRVQIHLPKRMLQALRQMSVERCCSVSALVRKPIENTYFQCKPPANWEQVLREASGSWKDRGDLPKSGEFIRNLRDDSRPQRFF